MDAVTEMSRRFVPCALALAAVLVLAATGPAHAHAFGQRYDLPVPLGLYLIGAGAAVALSFVVIGLFVRDVAWSRDYPRLDLLRFPPARLLAHPYVLGIVKLASVLLFVLIVAAGLFGEQSALKNLAPAMVWIIWWVGLGVVSAFVGNLWVLLNPWRTLFAWAEAVYGKLTGGGVLSRGLPLPPAVGVWPALAVLLAFVWLELIFPGSAAPANIAVAALVYSAITFAAMFLFGRERWLRHGEAFTLFFGILARFAPTEVRVTRREVCEDCGQGCADAGGGCIDCTECFARAAPAERQWNLRPWAVGLLAREPVSVSGVAFVLLMLASVLFDGLLVSPGWGRVEGALAAFAPGSEEGRLVAIRTFGLVVFWLLFLGAYLAVCRIMAGPRGQTGALARRFAFTLVPIAIAYHLAHYLSYLLVQGQYVIPLASDPFGLGWDLLGTAAYRIDIAVVGARFAWYTAVVAIVTGHVLAVGLAHLQALALPDGRRAALRGQYPMTALMVAYTVISLSILAEPIVQPPAAAAVADGSGARVSVPVPADALLPRRGDGRLVAVGPGRQARRKLIYQVMTSVFHDGTKMDAADILYPYGFAYRWGARDDEADADYDAFVDRATALARGRLAGVRLAGVDRTSKSIRLGEIELVREMLNVEVYLSAASGDAERAAAIAPPWSSVPWHVTALMEEAVRRGWAAFSEAEAARGGVPWLDLVRDDALKARLLSLVEAFERDGHVPQALEGRVDAQAARERWAALRAFHAARGHFLVTSGPYRIKQWPAEATVLEVVRDASYPLGVGSFDSYAIPRRAYIAAVERTDGGLRVAVEFEKLRKFARSHEILREPLDSADALAGQTLECRYLVLAEDGRVVLADSGRLGEDGSFALDLADRLAPGRYTVTLALYLNGNAVDPDIRRIPYTVPGAS